MSEEEKTKKCPFCKSTETMEVKFGYAEFVAKYRTAYNHNVEFCTGCKRLILPR